jgi:hypothetical protein
MKLQQLQQYGNDPAIVLGLWILIHPFMKHPASINHDKQCMSLYRMNSYHLVPCIWCREYDLQLAAAHDQINYIF